MNNGKWKDPTPQAKAHTRAVNAEIKQLLQTSPPSSHMSQPFTIDDITIAIKTLKNGKAPGNDNIHTEFLKNMAPEAVHWLQCFLSSCMASSTIPSRWKTAKVIAILKPKKPANDPKSYRPISLLSHIYKLLERMILTRINDTVEATLPYTQAGFRKGKSTTDQIVRLVNDIETAFQKKQKYGAVFIDLTAAFDTVWHRGLYLKLLKTLPDVKLVKFIMLLIQDRSFVLETSNGKCSRKRKLRNGVPQGSVLAPSLFNIYVSDVPKGDCSQYSYADDTALGTADASFEVLEATLQKDLLTMCHYFHQWHLKLSKPKTVSSVFHLANRLANREINIFLDGTKLSHDPTPKYLGVILDRSLTFHQHIKTVAAKTQSRVNLLRRLAGTRWGASYNTLHTSSIALAYSTAEYAAPVWSHSAHSHKVDVVLNDAMRLVSGCLMATPVEDLPILSGIPPANMRRNLQTIKLSKKCTEPGSLIPPPTAFEEQRLPRNHFATQALKLQSQHPYQQSWVSDRWSQQWSSTTSYLKQFVDIPSNHPKGCELGRKAWVNLNRLRTSVGRTKHFLHKIGVEPSPNCVCGEPQTISHIINDCEVFKSPKGTIGLINLDDDTASWLTTDLPL